MDGSGYLLICNVLFLECVCTTFFVVVSKCFESIPHGPMVDRIFWQFFLNFQPKKALRLILDSWTGNKLERKNHPQMLNVWSVHLHLGSWGTVHGRFSSPYIEHLGSSNHHNHQFSVDIVWCLGVLVNDKNKFTKSFFFCKFLGSIATLDSPYIVSVRNADRNWLYQIFCPDTISTILHVLDPNSVAILKIQCK